MLTERFDEALAYASRIHRTQVRKGGSIPYVSHLLGVCSLALEDGADEDQAIAALLHDAVQDQGGLDRAADIRQLFGDRVADIVIDNSDSDSEPKPPWRERKTAYLESLGKKPRASLEVSIADKTHNASAIVHDLREHGNIVWERFTGKRAGSLWYYRSLVEQFSALVPGPGANRLALIVAEMESLSSASHTA
ncbi:HD domain-containing protein [Erythrobacter sp. JGD-13]|uniref:HD domain-containing protein n=1 Tax=Aurantiacibacter sediminis TaxID=2793064 RepID=A0ABS0N1J1_9SPHN|nr:HD domain-containing protein [Aurantiacibacter sediminis]